MQKNNNTIWIVLLSVVLVVLVCAGAIAAYIAFFGPKEPETDSSAAYTQAAQTIVAQMTLDAGASAVARLTEQSAMVRTQVVSNLASATPAPTSAIPTQVMPTFVVPATATTWWIYPSATPIVIPPTPTSGPVTPCNRATFLQDVTIPDGTTIPPNTRFTKTWRVRNDGACFWDSSYSVVFQSGTPMTNTTIVPFPGTIPPGGSVDLSVVMTSPNKPGVFQGNWLMRSANGATFGVGSSGTNPLFIRIRVPEPAKPNPNYAYDFSANYCSAVWQTGVGTILCTNPPTDPEGSVVYQTDPQLESRNENEPGLWVRPNQAASGFINGRYPAYSVRSGDRFIAEIGCQYGWPKCDITFRVDYLLANGTSGNLGAWREVFDNSTYVINIDLSSLVGQSVQFSLRMQNNGNVSQANGIWFLPSIRNTPAPPTALPPTVTPTATTPPTATATQSPTPTPTLPVYPYPTP